MAIQVGPHQRAGGIHKSILGALGGVLLAHLLTGLAGPGNSGDPIRVRVRARVRARGRARGRARVRARARIKGLKLVGVGCR